MISLNWKKRLITNSIEKIIFFPTLKIGYVTEGKKKAEKECSNTHFSKQIKVGEEET